MYFLMKLNIAHPAHGLSTITGYLLYRSPGGSGLPNNCPFNNNDGGGPIKSPHFINMLLTFWGVPFITQFL